MQLQAHKPAIGGVLTQSQSVAVGPSTSHSRLKPQLPRRFAATKLRPPRRSAAYPGRNRRLKVPQAWPPRRGPPHPLKDVRALWLVGQSHCFRLSCRVNDFIGVLPTSFGRNKRRRNQAPLTPPSHSSPSSAACLHPSPAHKPCDTPATAAAPHAGWGSKPRSAPACG